MIDNLLTGGKGRQTAISPQVCMEAYRARYYMNKYPELVFLRHLIVG